MSLGLNKTKRRILSVRSTQKITKAMGMVATVKLKRFKDGFEQESAYRASLTRAMAAAFHYDKLTASHYGMENEEVEGILYLVITSNLGLCAGYNNEVFRYAESLIDPEIDTILPIGEKGRAHFLRDPRFKHVLTDEENLDLSMEPRLINRATLHLKNAFNQKKYRKIVIIYTRYVNSLRFVPDQKTLLPFSLEYEKEPYEEYCPPLFEPSPRELIHSLMPQYLGAVLYDALTESQLSEQASRRTAMDNANDNADEILNQLTIEYNKARQAAITQEITEVVGGANGKK